MAIWMNVDHAVAAQWPGLARDHAVAAQDPSGQSPPENKRSLARTLQKVVQKWSQTAIPGSGLSSPRMLVATSSRPLSHCCTDLGQLLTLFDLFREVCLLWDIPGRIRLVSGIHIQGFIGNSGGEACQIRLEFGDLLPKRLKSRYFTRKQLF